MDAMNRLRNKMLGNASTEIAPSGDNKPNPMLMGLMKSFGISPEAITDYAEKIKGAVEGKLSSIDDKLERIMATLLTIENKQNEMESNMRVLLDKATDDHEEQFAQMAEHPIEHPIT